MRRGELVLLTVLPNDDHGADSTLVEWTMREPDGQQRSWSVADVVPDLLKGNSWLAEHDAAWSFLEITPAPVFLTERRDSNGDQSELKSWSLGSEPAVFVNSGTEPIEVWTTYPARSFFVHPGPQRPVAVAWTSPIDGEIPVSGRVADVHPAGLDGVAFELAHIAAPELGQALADVGASSAGLPDAGTPPVIPVAYAVVDGVRRVMRGFRSGAIRRSLGPRCRDAGWQSSVAAKCRQSPGAVAAQLGRLGRSASAGCPRHGQPYLGMAFRARPRALVE